MTVTLHRVWNVEKIAEAVGGDLYGDRTATVNTLTTDSREVTDGALFVAIRGETADGHA